MYAPASACRPDVRLINLETSVTPSDDYWKGKGINYRMHPDNVGCLTAAKIDVCALANNHVLDYGYGGLEETIATLTRAGLTVADAGRTLGEAREPTWKPATTEWSSCRSARRRAASRRNGRRQAIGPASIFWTGCQTRPPMSFRVAVSA